MLFVDDPYDMRIIRLSYIRVNRHKMILCALRMCSYDRADFELGTHARIDNQYQSTNSLFMQNYYNHIFYTPCIDFIQM